MLSVFTNFRTIALTEIVLYAVVTVGRRSVFFHLGRPQYDRRGGVPPPLPCGQFYFLKRPNSIIHMMLNLWSVRKS